MTIKGSLNLNIPR